MQHGGFLFILYNLFYQRGDEDGKRLGSMIDSKAVERAARSGDTAAMQDILQQVLGTAEGRRLAESIRQLMQD